MPTIVASGVIHLTWWIIENIENIVTYSAVPLKYGPI